jgi:tripartite-type tricarboxylate transporter receptor subunit TctC
MMKWPLALAFAAATATAFISPAAGEVYPSRPIKIVVPFPAGGAFDTIARIVTEHMKVSLVQPVIIENMSGATGSVGVGRVARASPDGHTLSFGIWSTHVVNGAVYSLPYDVVKDFAPIALVATAPQVIVSSNAVPATNLRELVAWLKANPDRATLATFGSGSPMHIAGILIQQLTGAQFRFVPYRGPALAMQDLLSGQIDLSILQPAIALPHVRDGKIKSYAVTAKTRLSTAPDIPTVDEAGMPGVYVSVWSALWAPKGTPKSIIARLNTAVVSALADPEVRRRLTEIGQEIPPREQQTPEALAALQAAEIEKWWPIIKAAHIKAD